MTFKNINKTKEVRRLKKFLKRKQRQCSRKYEQNKNGKEYVKTKSIAKLEKQIKLIHRRLSINVSFMALNLFITNQTG